MALLTEVREAFKGVSRAGGTSWTVSKVIHDYGTHEQILAAHHADTDTDWLRVIDDARFDIGGEGGFEFLEPISYRYYLPAAITRFLRACEWTGDERACDRYWRKEELPSQFVYQFLLESQAELQWARDRQLYMLSLFDARQRRAVARFVKFMAAECAWRESHNMFVLSLSNSNEWQEAFASYWKDV